MKKFKLLTVLALSIIANPIFSQSKLVYKRNLLSGDLEVFESRGGIPGGNALYNIKRNVWGYLEIENLNASTNPYTKKPDYSDYNIKTYQLPVKEIFETIEALNKQNEFDYLLNHPVRNNAEYNEQYARVSKSLADNSATASAFLKFYNQNISFPRTLKDGWYDVVDIFDAKKINAEFNATGDFAYTFGICKVQNNKISEYYENRHINGLKTGYVFQKMKIEVASTISSCKSMLRCDGSDDYISLYFLDNIIDSLKQIGDPNFSYYSIFTNFNTLNNQTMIIQIARNKTITRDDILNINVGPYLAVMTKLNPKTNDCNNSILTLAFRKKQNVDNRYSIAVSLSSEMHWIFNDLSLYPGTCSSTVLEAK